MSTSTFECAEKEFERKIVRKINVILKKDSDDDEKANEVFDLFLREVYHPSVPYNFPDTISKIDDLYSEDEHYECLPNEVKIKKMKRIISRSGLL